MSLELQKEKAEHALSKAEVEKAARNLMDAEQDNKRLAAMNSKLVDELRIAQEVKSIFEDNNREEIRVGAKVRRAPDFCPDLPTHHVVGTVKNIYIDVQWTTQAAVSLSYLPEQLVVVRPSVMQWRID